MANTHIHSDLWTIKCFQFTHPAYFWIVAMPNLATVTISTLWIDSLIYSMLQWSLFIKWRHKPCSVAYWFVPYLRRETTLILKQVQNIVRKFKSIKIFPVWTSYKSPIQMISHGDFCKNKFAWLFCDKTHAFWFDYDFSILWTQNTLLKLSVTC